MAGEEGTLARGTWLPIDLRDGRGLSVDQVAGDVFAEDEEFDGIVLTVEPRSVEEADSVMQALTQRGA